jgi:hypothetical protein
VRGVLLAMRARTAEERDEARAAASRARQINPLVARDYPLPD